MDKKKKGLALPFLPLLVLLVGSAYPAFANFEKVVISAPSSTKIGQPIQVQATILVSRGVQIPGR